MKRKKVRKWGKKVREGENVEVREESVRVWKSVKLIVDDLIN